MQCPACGGKTRVTNTTNYKLIILRLRKCTKCPFEFNTREKPSPTALLAISSEKRAEPTV